MYPTLQLSANHARQNPGLASDPVPPLIVPARVESRAVCFYPYGKDPDMIRVYTMGDSKAELTARLVGEFKVPRSLIHDSGEPDQLHVYTAARISDAQLIERLTDAGIDCLNAR